MWIPATSTLISALVIKAIQIYACVFSRVFLCVVFADILEELLTTSILIRQFEISHHNRLSSFDYLLGEKSNLLQKKALIIVSCRIDVLIDLLQKVFSSVFKFCSQLVLENNAQLEGLRLIRSKGWWSGQTLFGGTNQQLRPEPFQLSPRWREVHMQSKWFFSLHG